MSRRPIPDFPGYEITEDGRVWSNAADRFLNPQKNGGGYFFVRLCKNKQCYSKLVSRLVLETFVGPCPVGMMCCHYNDIKIDNRLINLRWDTCSNNHKDAFRNGKYNHEGENHPQAKLNNLQVRIIKHLLKYPKEFTQREISRLFKISQPIISYIKKGKRWKHLTKK